MPSLVAVLATAIAVSLPATVAHAVTRQWIVGDGDWTTPANWSPSGVPGNGDNVGITFSDDIARTVNYDYSGPLVALDSLSIDLYGAGANFITLSITSASLLSTTNDYLGAVGRVAVEQSAGSHSVSSELYLAYYIGSFAVYNLSNSAVLAVSGDEYVGLSGAGTLNISGGAQASNANANLGFNVGASGTVTVDGPGSKWINNGVAAVGVNGTGSLSVTNGGYVSSVNGRIGREPGSTGAAFLDGPSSRWQMTGDLTVGGVSGSGIGTLTIQNEAVVHVGNNLAINNVSTVNLNGGTLRFNTASGLNRLNYTSGTVQLAGNRHFASDSAITALFGSTPNIASGKGLSIEGQGSIGSGATPVESVSVSGGRLKATTLRVGGDGSGLLNVTNGGALDVGSGGLNVYGNEMPKIGSVLVSGTGSSANSEGRIQVGGILAGGSMTISNGAVVTCTNEAGIQGPLGTSSVTVTGPGSAWYLPNSYLIVGGSFLGYGTLNVQDGATVFVGTQLLIYSSSSKVNVAGGTLRFDTIAGSAGLSGINYTSGVIQLAGDRIIGADSAIQALYGASPLIPTGKGLTVEGTATLSSNLTLQGGAFIANAIDGTGLLDFQGGTLGITGPAGLTIDSGTPLGPTVSLGSGQQVNVTNSLHVGAAGRLTNPGGRVVPGSVVIDAGGRWTVTDGVQSVGTGLLNHGTLAFIDATINGPVTSPAGTVVNVVGDVTFTDSFSGASQFYGSGTTNFNGGYNPGDSPAAVSFEGSVALGAANSLTIELGGVLPGAEFDQLNVSGNLAIDGALEVSLTEGFIPSTGQSFDILDWGSLSGNFSSLVLPTLAGLAWDTSQLYTTGVLGIATAPGLPGDFNLDGTVNAADYVVWRKGAGISSTQGNYDLWRTNFGRTASGGAGMETPAVPEPAAFGMLWIVAGTILGIRRRCITRTGATFTATVLVSLLVFTASDASAQSTTWVGNTGSWFDAANWSLLGGTPSSTVGARINNGGTAQVFSGSAEAKDIVVGALSTHSGAIHVGGTGTLSTNAAGGVNPGLVTIGDAGTGTLNVSSGGLVGFRGTTLGAAATGVGTAIVNGQFNPGYDFIVGAAGTGNVMIANGGAVYPSQTILGRDASGNGQMTVDGPGTTLGQTLGIIVGLDGTGSLLVTNGAIVDVREAAVAAYGAGSGTATIQGAGSRWNNTRLEIGTGGTGNVQITDGAVMHVNPYFDGTRKAILGPGGTLSIGAGGLSGTLETSVVENAGTFNFNHIETITFATQITGTGNIFNSGLGSTTLTNVAGFTGQIAATGGTLTLPGTTAASILGASTSGTLRLDATTVNLGSTGLVRSLAGSTVEYNAAQINGGFLRGPGLHQVVTNAIPSRFNGVTTYNSVDLVQGSDAVFTNFTNGGRLTNNAFLTFDGGTNAASGVITVNSTLSAADFTTNGVITVNSGGTLEHSLSNLVAGGGSRTTVHSGGTIDLLAGSELDLNGALLVNNGTINGTVNVHYGSLAKGAGTYSVVNVNEGGVYAPGSSPGISTAAAVEFQNGAFSTAAPRLVIELAGTTAGAEYDQLHVTGPLSLAGVLDVTLTGGFVPAAGQSFDILDWGSLSGNFSSLFLPTLAGLAWDTSQLYTTGVLSIAAAPGLPGDFNQDATVNAADYIVWSKGIVPKTAPNYQLWVTNFGRTAGGGGSEGGVLEPSATLFIASVAVAILVSRSMSRRVLLVAPMLLFFVPADNTIAASLDIVATGQSITAIEGLTLAEVTIGGADPRIVAMHDDQDGNIDTVHLSTQLLGSGAVTYGHLSGDISAQAENSGTGNPYSARTNGNIRLSFTDTAVVSSPTLALGTPVTLSFQTDLAASAFLTPGANAFNDNGSIAALDTRVTDLTTNQFAAVFNAVSPSFVGPPTITRMLNTQIGRTLRLFAQLELAATVRIDDNFTTQGIIRTAAAGASSAELSFLPSGDIALLSESGHNYTLATSLDGDFNQDGTVNAADYVVWRKGVGVASTQGNYDLWRINFGRTSAGGAGGGAQSARDGSWGANHTVPEPSGFALLLATISGLLQAAARQCRAIQP